MAERLPGSASLQGVGRRGGSAVAVTNNFSVPQPWDVRSIGRWLAGQSRKSKRRPAPAQFRTRCRGSRHSARRPCGGEGAMTSRRRSRGHAGVNRRAVARASDAGETASGWLGRVRRRRGTYGRCWRWPGCRPACRGLALSRTGAGSARAMGAPRVGPLPPGQLCRRQPAASRGQRVAWLSRDALCRGAAARASARARRHARIYHADAEGRGVVCRASTAGSGERGAALRPDPDALPRRPLHGGAGRGRDAGARIPPTTASFVASSAPAQRRDTERAKAALTCWARSRENTASASTSVFRRGSRRWSASATMPPGSCVREGGGPPHRWPTSIPSPISCSTRIGSRWRTNPNSRPSSHREGRAAE